jgi:hypothetical protein
VSVTINNPAELNAPANAEAFLRECLDGMDRHSAEMEARAQQEIQRYRERHQENPEAQRRYEHKIMDDLHAMLAPHKKNRKELAETIALYERLARAIAEVERIRP